MHTLRDTFLRLLHGLQLDIDLMNSVSILVDWKHSIVALYL